ncbi:MBL fold metallo-hydrolase [Gallaecimonas sp. GXIMD4217]|uniref:MBL fold metallo-hydrolase n=1 Tax=Gallaecimonas sp. GXIMD4217 TaxID=3131927 RepID=UPI00311B3D3B
MARLLAPLLATLALAAHAAPLKMENVTGPLHVIYGQGGNIGVLQSDRGFLLIDDQYAPATEAIRAQVASLGKESIRFVLNTHWHQDHTGGNEHMGQAGAVIIAHDKVRQRLSADQFLSFFNKTITASPDIALPVVTFSRDIRLHLGTTVEVLHVAHAHTDGDAMVFFPDLNAVHMGDTYFAGMFPFIDLDHGGHIDGMIAAAEQVLARADEQTRIIPGHGPVSDKKALADYLYMLKRARERIQVLMAQGKSLEEIIKAKPLKDFGRFGGGFVSMEQMTTFVHQSLQTTQ